MYPSKPFEDCLEKITYTTKIQRKDFLESGDFPIVSQEIGDINGYWNNESDVFEIKKPVIVFGDHTKIIKYIDFDFVLGADGVKILQPKKFLDTRYFCYFLQSVELKSLGYARHYRLLRELNVPIPPLSTQLDIVARLDSAMSEIDSLCTETESALASTRELWESTLESVFASGGNDWEEKRLSEICEKITDGTHQTPTYYTDGIIFLSSRNVTSGKIDWDNIKYIDHKQHVEMHKRVNPRMNDILLAKNGTTGVAAMVDRDTIFDIYVSLALLRAREMILPSLLLFFINSPVAKKQFNKRLKGSGVPNLHLEEIREVAISFPKSLPEQSRIVAHLDAVRAETERLERLYTEKLTSLDELRRSVLADVFSS